MRLRDGPVAARMERFGEHFIAKLGLTAGVVACVVGLVVGGGPPHRPSYHMLDELIASDLARWEGEDIIVHGYVETGSIADVPGHDLTSRFVLTRGGKRIQVVATSPSSWLVRDQNELSVRGHLVSAGAAGLAADPPYVLMVSALNGKCPSKYDGSAMYRCPACPTVPSDPLMYH
jgi:hypothetical protein